MNGYYENKLEEEKIKLDLLERGIFSKLDEIKSGQEITSKNVALTLQQYSSILISQKAIVEYYTNEAKKEAENDNNE